MASPSDLGFLSAGFHPPCRRIDLSVTFLKRHIKDDDPLVDSSSNTPSNTLQSLGIQLSHHGGPYYERRNPEDGGDRP
jgi:hypothetical protein